MVRPAELVAVVLVCLMVAGGIAAGAPSATASPNDIHYEPNWESLAQWAVPEWFEDAVLGIYFHWGVYSVAGMGEWYGCYMYGSMLQYHEETYGDPCTEFGYKDFIPMFKAEKWDPDLWAELFENSGADFAGPVVEHHDGFAMWDTEYDEYNSMDMGPKRDVVGEIAQAIRARGMRLVTTFHNVRNWMFYDPGRVLCPDGMDVNDPTYSGLYGPVHESGDPISENFKEECYNKIIEVIDKYQPDQMWFEHNTFGALGGDYALQFLAHYFNAAENLGKEVLVAHKGADLPRSVSVLDLESAQLPEPDPLRWQTDIGIYDWGYSMDQENKTVAEIEGKVNQIVDNIVDRTSKNGVTLLSIGPKADGTIPEPQVKVLNKLGDWMDVNKEALYGTDWRTPCEVGTLRFTVKGDFLYAIELEEPKVGMVIPVATPVPGSEIRMLGCDTPLTWHQEGGDVVIDELPDTLPCDYAWSFKIQVSEISDVTPPAPFDLLSPPNNATISDNTPTLVWEASSDEGSGLDHYEVWADGANVDNVTPPSTSFTSSTLSQGTHSWYITAVDKAGNERESEVFAFEVTGEGVEPAMFELGDLSISKATVEPGEGFTISVLVTNTGGESGSYTVELSIDGETKTEEVTLDPGASETVSFDVSIEDEGTYTVSAGDMTESVEVSAPEQPEGGEFPIIPVAAGVIVVIAVIGILAYKRKG